MSDDGKISLLWGAQEVMGGWQPYYRHNGKYQSLWHWDRPIDKDQALREAKHWAEEEASRYRGYLTVTIAADSRA